MMDVRDLKCFVIVVEDNPTSEFYFSKISPVWNSLGIFPSRFKAITPATLPADKLIFRRNHAFKYIKTRGKEFTETEKSCFTSHFLLWEKCVELNEKILVIEHDSIPFNPARLYYNEETWFKSFDMGAMGCYVIDPFFARLSITRIQEQGVCSGPMGELQHFFCGHHPNAQHSFVVREGQMFHNAVSKGYRCATTQIYHGGWSTSVRHGDYSADKVWPYYVNIENAPDVLTLDWIRRQVLRFEYGRKSFNI